MKSVYSACVFMLLACALSRAQNPIPLLIQPLVPASVAPGSGAFTLTVNGTGFTIERHGVLERIVAQHDCGVAQHSTGEDYRRGCRQSGYCVGDSGESREGRSAVKCRLFPHSHLR